jgi:hypothetical protein
MRGLERRGRTDLAGMLANLDPRLLAGEFVFCSLPDARLSEIAHLNPLGTFQETEGLTVVLAIEIAIEHGLPVGLPLRCIRLHVHSDLAAVGLTAAFSSCLAACGISANVVSGFFHDHIFVPAPDAMRALQALQSLQSGNLPD